MNILFILKIVDTLLKGNIKDKDVIEDVEYVGQVLEKNLKILSLILIFLFNESLMKLLKKIRSFEKYVKELNAGHLEWSPVHSEKFWKENVKKFEDHDFDLIK